MGRHTGATCSCGVVVWGWVDQGEKAVMAGVMKWEGRKLLMGGCREVMLQDWSVVRSMG